MIAPIARRRRFRSFPTLVLLLIAAGVAAGGFVSRDRLDTDPPTAVVRRGAFRDAVVESGSLGAAGLRLYGSTIPGVQAKIVGLIAEGREVAAGDELIRFDAVTFELALARENAVLAQAEAEYARIEGDERLELLAATAESDAVSKKIAAAESSLLNETEGRGQIALDEATLADQEAARQLFRARQQFQDIEALLAKGFATRAEVDRAALDLGRAEDQRRLATRKLESLKGFERPAALDQGRAAVDAARQDRQRSRDAATARLAQRRAALTLAARRVEESRARVAAAADHLSRTVVRSAGPGLIVYRDLFFGTDRRKPQVGDEVWSNQPVLAIPDTRDLLVETRVREIDLQRVTRSRRVSVRVDAYPDLDLAGTITLVGTLAQEDAERTGVKYLPVTIKLSATDPQLRPGMTARVEMIVFDSPDGLIIPSAALSGLDRPACDVVTSSRTRRVPLRIIATNGIEALVDGELRAGDRLMLHPAGGAMP